MEIPKTKESDMLKKMMMLFLLACYIWDVSAQEKHSEWSSFERKQQDKIFKINKEKRTERLSCGICASEFANDIV